MRKIVRITPPVLCIHKIADATLHLPACGFGHVSLVGHDETTDVYFIGDPDQPMNSWTPVSGHHLYVNEASAIPTGGPKTKPNVVKEKKLTKGQLRLQRIRARAEELGLDLDDDLLQLLEA